MLYVITGIHMASQYFGGCKDAGIFSLTSAIEPVAINSNDFWLGVCCPCLNVLEVKVMLEFQNLCQEYASECLICICCCVASLCT